MYAIKAEIDDSTASFWSFKAQRTMYRGKCIGVGDTVFIFASETQGGCGLIAIGAVSQAEATPKRQSVERQTPRVGVTIRRTGTAKRHLGRRELKSFNDWGDGRPETELNFKLYRQATNKVVGLSPETSAFLLAFF